MTDTDLVASYTNLLLIEYSDPANQPNAIATIQLIATVAIANQIVGQVYSGFSLGAYGQAMAVGAQLDILGTFVGAQRVLPNYSPILNFLSFGDTTAPSEPAFGFLDTTNSSINPSVIWESTNQTIGSYTLSDGEMIALIEYLEAVNNAYLSVSEIDAILFDAFGADVTVTEGVMILSYSQGAYTGTIYGIVKYLNAFPHPAGVEIAA